VTALKRLKSSVKMRPMSAILYLRRHGTEPPHWRAWIIGAMRLSDDTESLTAHAARYCPGWELRAYRFSGGRLVRLGEFSQAELEAAEAALPR
jgi:hypothetical protein